MSRKQVNNKKADCNNNGTRNNKYSRQKNNKKTRKDIAQEKEPVYNDRDRQFHSNDPSWWNKTGQLAKDAGSISTSNAIGSKLPGFEKNVPWFTPAGIMKLEYLPFFGTVKGTTDPINVAARRLYDVINAKNSRNPSYDPSDLMLYVVAVANAWGLHAWLKRAIGLMLTYAPQNRYIPDALLESMGIAPISAQNDITKWRNVANRLALRLNMLAVPNGIDYFKRAIFMNSGIYMDDPTSKASLMYFNPSAILAYREPDATHDAAYLSYEEIPVGSTGVTPEEMNSMIDKVLAPLFNSSDITTMSSDIIKAYGLENCFTLPAITEAEVTVPEYNPEVLLQINNAMVLPCIDRLLIDYEVKQNMNNNTLVADFVTSAEDASGVFGVLTTLPHPINFPVDNPDSDMFLEASRLMFGVRSGHFDYCGTEVITDCHVMYFESSAEGNWDVVERSIPATYTFKSTTTTSTVLQDFAKYNKFNCAPLFHAFLINQKYTDIVFHRCLSDVANYTAVTNIELSNMHEAALLSVFAPKE